jgi:hypothetical protein
MGSFTGFFSPGLAFEDQVGHQFGSSVHFSPSHRAKEFFLVVSFSSTSFTLSDESFGLALQCCIGGDRKGFRVYQLLDRRFRFSMESCWVACNDEKHDLRSTKK